MSGHEAGNPFRGFDLMTHSLPALSKSGRTGWLAAGLLTCILCGLHGWLWLNAGAFCGDEVNVINLAHAHSLSEMAHDSFPVLLPLLIRGWTGIGLGGTDAHLRLLGLLIGLALAGALWLPAWTGRRAPPLLSLILFGLNGTAIFWTDYLRAYGVGSLGLLLTLAAMCRLLEKPDWKRAGLLAVMAVLSVQALYQNAVFVAAIALGGWLVCWSRKDRAAAVRILVAALAGAISLLPYLAIVLGWQRATTIRPGFSFKAALDNLHTVLAFPLPQYFWLWALLGAAVLALGGAVWFRPPPSLARTDTRMTEPELRMFAGAILLSSLTGYAVFLHFAALITSPWYFLPLMAVGAACFDLGISRSIFPRRLRTVGWGILAGTVVLSVPFAMRDLHCRFSNMDLVAERLMKEISPPDYVVVTPWHLGISFSRYYHGGAGWDTWPPVADHAGYRFDLVPATSADEARVTQPVLDRIANALRTGHRVWVVGWMDIPVPGRTAASVEGRFLAAHSQTFEPVDLKIKGQTSDYEDVSLLRADGWRGNQP
jgi:hypothetical protein